MSFKFEEIPAQIINVFQKVRSEVEKPNFLFKEIPPEKISPLGQRATEFFKTAKEEIPKLTMETLALPGKIAEEETRKTSFAPIAPLS